MKLSEIFKKKNDKKPTGKRVIELEGGHVIRDQVRGVYGYTG